MTVKKIISIAILFFSICSIHAQSKPRFSSQNYLGIIVGENGTNPQLQSINGIVVNKWFTGIGTGIDWYYQRSVPLFLSVNRSFLQRGKRNFMIAADAGANFPWKDNRYYNDWYYGDVKTFPGFYWSGGFGYRIGMGKQNDALLLHLGYSYKFFRERVTSTLFCINPPCPENVETFNYNLRRLSLKLGWSF
jgi:hypothetical protein